MHHQGNGLENPQHDVSKPDVDILDLEIALLPTFRGWMSFAPNLPRPDCFVLGDRRHNNCTVYHIEYNGVRRIDDTHPTRK